MICEVECVIEHIQASIMNERKIAIDGIRSTKWQLYKVEEFEFVKEIEGRDDIQVKDEKWRDESNKVWERHRVNGKIYDKSNNG